MQKRSFEGGITLSVLPCWYVPGAVLPDSVSFFRPYSKLMLPMLIHTTNSILPFGAKLQRKK